MFLIKPQKPVNPSKKLTVMLEMLEKKFGEIPPHFQVLGTLDPEGQEHTLSYLLTLTNHPTIAPNLFIFIRLYVAQRERYHYCIEFNSHLLKNIGYSEEIISCVKHDIANVPLGEREKLLGIKAIKAIYSPQDFTVGDLNELYAHEWDDREIFTAIDHAGYLLKNGRIIAAYLDDQSLARQ